MFCTKCGKELFPGDNFCAHCGKEVRAKAVSRYDDIVFNPPFKQEAKRKTEELIGFAKSKEFESSSKKTEPITLDWGMEKTEPKKARAAAFDWSQVVEQKSGQRKIEVEKLDTSANRDLFIERERQPRVTVVGISQPTTTISCEVEEEPLSIEELEKEIFGEIETKSQMAEDIEAHREDKTHFEKNECSMEEISEAPETDNIVIENNDSVHDELNDYVVVKQADTIAIDDERFYTFNQKCGAFDELIQKEKERLNTISDGEYIFDSDADKTVEEDPVQESMDISIDELPPVFDSENDYLASFPPEKTIAVEPVGKYDKAAITVAPQEEFKAAFTQEAEAESEETKANKLRYSDVFPRVPVDEEGNPVKGYEEPNIVVRHEPVVPQIIAQNKARQAEERKKQESRQLYNKRSEKADAELKDLTGIFDSIELEEDEPKKKHILSKIIITLLVLLLLAEGVILGTKLVAPDSPFSIWINEKALGAVEYVFSRLNSNDDADEDDNTAIYDHMNLLVSEASSKSKKVGEISYDRELKFSVMPDFVFPEVAVADSFVDEDWYADKDGSERTYGQVLMETIVKYYDNWNKINEDDNLVGINVLEIGETRTTNDGFYTLARLTLATADGGQDVRYQTVFTKVSDKSIVINMVKEETINEGQ